MCCYRYEIHDQTQHWQGLGSQFSWLGLKLNDAWYSLLKMKSKSALKYELFDLNLEAKYVPKSKTCKIYDCRQPNFNSIDINKYYEYINLIDNLLKHNNQ